MTKFLLIILMLLPIGVLAQGDTAKTPPPTPMATPTPQTAPKVQKAKKFICCDGVVSGNRFTDIKKAFGPFSKDQWSVSLTVLGYWKPLKIIPTAVVQTEIVKAVFSKDASVRWAIGFKVFE